MKLIIASILIFSIVILFLFALFPADVSVTRIVQINKPPEQVYKKIADLREWKSWNDFLKDETGIPIKNAGTGKNDSVIYHASYVTIEILKSVADTVITSWQRGNKSIIGNFVLYPQANGQTILEWTMHFHIQWYPWEKLASMFYEKQLGPVMEQSLMHLQTELENK